MDSHTPAAGAFGRPSTIQPASAPDQRPTGGDIEPACTIVNATVAIAFGVAQPHCRAAPRQADQPVLARQVAMYLVHVAFGMSMGRIAQAFRRHRTTVVHACHRVEDRRDDPGFDRLLDSLEAAATALRQAYYIHHQR